VCRLDDHLTLSAFTQFTPLAPATASNERCPTALFLRMASWRRGRRRGAYRSTEASADFQLKIQSRESEVWGEERVPWEGRDQGRDPRLRMSWTPCTDRCLNEKAASQRTEQRQAGLHALPLNGDLRRKHTCRAASRWGVFLLV
jgi:hypothetical protein